MKCFPAPWVAALLRALPLCYPWVPRNARLRLSGWQCEAGGPHACFLGKRKACYPWALQPRAARFVGWPLDPAAEPCDSSGLPNPDEPRRCTMAKMVALGILGGVVCMALLGA